jgi:2-haloacid dehalogenase
MTTPVLLFDVNETLLDMRALDPLFEQAFGMPSMRQPWFLTLQGLWMTATLTSSFVPFDKLARAALDMTARREGLSIDGPDRTAILESLKRLPPHAEVAGALDTLRRSGVRLAALTNGTSQAVRTQLRHAGLFDKFDEIISVDQVEVYKPARTPYLFAARRFRARADRVSLIAAHHWDLAGAKAAGLTTVFVRRPGAVLNPLGPKPDIAVADLEEFAQRLAARRRRIRQ